MVHTEQNRGGAGACLDSSWFKTGQGQGRGQGRGLEQNRTGAGAGRGGACVLAGLKRGGCMPGFIQNRNDVLEMSEGAFVVFLA